MITASSPLSEPSRRACGAAWWQRGEAASDVFDFARRYGTAVTGSCDWEEEGRGGEWWGGGKARGGGGGGGALEAWRRGTTQVTDGLCTT